MDKQMDRPTALSRSCCREQRLNNWSAFSHIGQSEFGSVSWCACITIQICESPQLLLETFFMDKCGNTYRMIARLSVCVSVCVCLSVSVLVGVETCRNCVEIPVAWRSNSTGFTRKSCQGLGFFVKSPHCYIHGDDFNRLYSWLTDEWLTDWVITRSKDRGRIDRLMAGWLAGSMAGWLVGWQFSVGGHVTIVKRDIGQKLQFSYPLAFDAPVRRSALEYCHTGQMDGRMDGLIDWLTVLSGWSCC